MEGLFGEIRKQFDIGEVDVVSYSPLTLAYIGDAIYETLIRTVIVAEGNTSVNKLHKRTSDLVKASAQAGMMQVIMDQLTETELTIYKRGRNAKSYTMAKNATMKDYRSATGFEALMGYLYMDNQMHRLIELVKLGLESCR